MVSAERTIPAATRTDFEVRGMDCQNCVRHVREALLGVPGVSHVAVDLQSHRATVKWDEQVQPNVQAAIAAVAEAGYETSEIRNRDSAPAPAVSGWALNLILGLPVVALLMLGEWVFHWHGQAWFQWVAFILASVVQFVAGARFYRGAWRQLKARSSNMDTLVALGSTTAYVYSVWALFRGAHVFFLEASAIITLISVGHWLEMRMSDKAAGSIKKLLGLTPAQARRRTADGSEEIVSLASVRHGDVLVLRPGDSVPTDGVIIEGSSTIDESMLTGESMPVDKPVGALIYGGTMNVDGRIAMRVQATGEQTALAQIIAAVERAQGSRADIQRLGDRVSSVFVPIVVAVAIVTALWWGLAPDHARGAAAALSKFLWPVHFAESALALAVIHAAAVLIVACPCAMGLATPAAIMAGANAAAERGILIRDGVALEKAGKITAIVFDKTGTLTHGKPEVTSTKLLSEVQGMDVAAVAAGLARHSNHPLSQALARISAAPVEIADFQELRGAGVQGRYRGQLVQLGALRWLRDTGVPIDAIEMAAGTIVALAISSKPVALFSLQDTLKPGAADVVRELQRDGLQTFLLSGDNARTAEAIAGQVGIAAANVIAEVRPEEKAEFVKRLQQQGGRVAFVGDGLNDAPALEQADLGIAVGKATDVAKMAADIVLVTADVHAIPESLRIARSTLRVIKQNLFWAFFYNTAAIPLAAMGFLSPVLCALTMGLSDVVVIGNALRLRLLRR
jgi:Cu+-exporting ATPase